jgi:hypothetical protein
MAMGLISCLPNFFGVGIGFRIQDHIDHALFRKIVVLVIGVSGIGLVVRSIWG